MLAAIEGAFDEVWFRYSLAVYDTKNIIQQIKKSNKLFRRAATASTKRLYNVYFFTEIG